MSIAGSGGVISPNCASCLQSCKQVCDSAVSTPGNSGGVLPQPWQQQAGGTCATIRRCVAPKPSVEVPGCKWVRKCTTRRVSSPGMMRGRRVWWGGGRWRSPRMRGRRSPAWGWLPASSSPPWGMWGNSPPRHFPGSPRRGSFVGSPIFGSPFIRRGHSVSPRGWF